MGYSYGARYKRRLLSAVKLSLCIAFCIMLCGMILFLALPGELLAIFDNDPSLIATGIPALRTICLCFPVAGVCIMLSTMFQGVGKGNYSLIISLMRQLVVLLPAAYLLSKLGLSYFWWAFPIAEGMSLAASIFLFVRQYNRDIKFLDGDK